MGLSAISIGNRKKGAFLLTDAYGCDFLTLCDGTRGCGTSGRGISARSWSESEETTKRERELSFSLPAPGDISGLDFATDRRSASANGPSLARSLQVYLEALGLKLEALRSRMVTVNWEPSSRYSLYEHLPRSVREVRSIPLHRGGKETEGLGLR